MFLSGRMLYFVSPLCAILLASCGGRAFIHEPFDAADIRARAETQT